MCVVNFVTNIIFSIDYGSVIFVWLPITWLFLIVVGYYAAQTKNRGLLSVVQPFPAVETVSLGSWE